MHFPHLAQRDALAGWPAHLALAFAHRDGGTVLAKRSHCGPLAVQKPLYQEGPAVCQAIVLHPPGGVAGGDALSLEVEVGERARALITTPGAGKWYRSNGPQATQSVRLAVARSAVLEWLPQETIVFEGARARLRTRVELDEEALFIGWEINCYGRTAAGERFDSGWLAQSTEILRKGVPLFGEYARIVGGSTLLQSRCGLAGHPVSALMLAAGGECGSELLSALRKVGPQAGALAGVTTLPGIALARYLGPSAQDARAYCMRLWALLRPALTGREALAPRIWSC